jgi:uncharacterized protein (DUF1501 family)
LSRITRRTLLSKMIASDLKGGKSNEEPALIFVFLRGGADTLNMLVPCGDDGYYRSRPTIAIPSFKKSVKDAALKIDDFYGLHPKLKPILPLYQEGTLGFVQAVGSDNPSGSHFDAQDQLEHGVAYNQSANGGWLGRHLSTCGEGLGSLSAVSIGTIIPESLRGAPNVSAMTSIEDVQLTTPTKDSCAACKTLGALYNSELSLITESGRETLALLERVRNLKSNLKSTADKFDYPKDTFGSGLHEVATLVRGGVGLKVACLDFGGWDTHFFQGNAQGLQANNIDSLARGLAAFDRELGSFRKKAVTLVMTEFGRRTYENGSMGTDHGRGFAVMAMGASINGGKVHGKWPGLEKQEADILGPAGLKIIYDYRSVLAEVLTGVLNNCSMDKVFPNFRPQAVGLVERRV